MPTEAQKKVNAQKARVARAMEPHYKTFGVLKKPGPGQSNELKTEIYDSWMRWIEEQEQEDVHWPAETYITYVAPCVPVKVDALQQRDAAHNTIQQGHGLL